VFVSIFTFTAAWAAAGCSTPWGSGYTIEKQRIEVTYTKEKPDRVSVRAWYQLKNTGKVPLASISIELPIHPTFTDNLRAEWSATALQSAAVPDNEHQMQFTFGSSWKPVERGEFVVSYELKVVDTTHPLVVGGAPPFFLPSKDWYPVLTPPSGTFSEPNPPPAKWDLVVSVPQGYHVYASGRPARLDRAAGKNATSGASSRFEQRTLIDFNPFVAAGPYVEQRVKTSDGTVMLWSSHPVPDKRAHEVSERVSSDAKYLTMEFGLRETRDMPVWIIECPPLDPSEPLIQLNKGCNSEPRAVIVPAWDFGSNAAGSEFRVEDFKLAESWFGMSISDAMDAPPWLTRGARAYASFAVIASHDPTYRKWAISTGLGILESSKLTMEKPLLGVKREDSEFLVGAAYLRSELFLIALEDRCGEKNVHNALERILRIQRGSTWNVSDLRSAMEAECGGADLADFFREWLNKPGIPEEFRKRYSGPAPAKAPGPSQ
jgi:hypothetical protein